MKTLALVAALAAPFPGFANVVNPALAFRATISIPQEIPAGSQVQYAWVMGTGGTSFTQIGWAWWPDMQPMVFAYTAALDNAAHGTWALGPEVTPGATVTVQIVRNGAFLVDEFQANGGWMTLQSGLVDNSHEFFTTEMEDWGPVMPTCFTHRGWESSPGVWHHLVSGCYQ